MELVKQRQRERVDMYAIANQVRGEINDWQVIF